MANKEQKNSMNLGEITTIRNILMGQQMNEYDSRFESVQENLNALEASLNQQINALEKKIKTISNYDMNITVVYNEEKKETIKSPSRDDDDLIITTLNYLMKKGR